MNKFLKYITVLVVLVGQATYAQYQNPVTLSDSAKVNIILVDRDKEELFQVFGHVTIQVSDASQYLDRVYSYGAFDFRTEGFYWKFITGRLPYQVVSSTLPYTMMEYGPGYENRSLSRFELNLTKEDKQRIFNLLEENLLPQNKTYQYKFFHDNCSTRIRDILEKGIGEKLTWIDSGEQKLSYRNWMNSRLFDRPFAAYGMNLAIGWPSDEICDERMAMYLPDNLAQSLTRAKNGSINLSQKPNVLYQSPKTFSGNFWEYFLIALVLPTIGGVIYWKSMTKGETLFQIALFVIGIFGLLIAFLWFGTIHGVTQYNIQLLWAWPTHLWAAFQFKRAKSSNYFKYWGYGVILYGCGIVLTNALRFDLYNCVAQVSLLIFAILLYLSFKNIKKRTNLSN